MCIIHICGFWFGVHLPLRKTHSGSLPLNRPGVAIPLFSRAKATSAPHAVRVAWQ